MILCVYVCVSGWCRRFYLSPDVNRSGPSSPRMGAGVGCVFWNVLMLCLSGRITTRGSISIQVEKQACRSQDAASLLPSVAQRQSSKQKKTGRRPAGYLIQPSHRSKHQLSFQSWSRQLSQAPSNSTDALCSSPLILCTFECLGKINQSLN